MGMNQNPRRRPNLPPPNRGSAGWMTNHPNGPLAQQAQTQPVRPQPQGPRGPTDVPGQQGYTFDPGSYGTSPTAPGHLPPTRPELDPVPDRPRRNVPPNRGSDNWLAKHPNGALAQQAAPQGPGGNRDPQERRENNHGQLGRDGYYEDGSRDAGDPGGVNAYGFVNSNGRGRGPGDGSNRNGNGEWNHHYIPVNTPAGQVPPELAGFAASNGNNGGQMQGYLNSLGYAPGSPESEAIMNAMQGPMGDYLVQHPEYIQATLAAYASGGSDPNHGNLPVGVGSDPGYMAMQEANRPANAAAWASQPHGNMSAAGQAMVNPYIDRPSYGYTGMNGVTPTNPYSQDRFGTQTPLGFDPMFKGGTTNSPGPSKMMGNVAANGISSLNDPRYWMQ